MAEAQWSRGNKECRSWAPGSGQEDLENNEDLADKKDLESRR